MTEVVDDPKVAGKSVARGVGHFGAAMVAKKVTGSDSIEAKKEVIELAERAGVKAKGIGAIGGKFIGQKVKKMRKGGEDKEKDVEVGNEDQD